MTIKNKTSSKQKRTPPINQNTEKKQLFHKRQEKFISNKRRGQKDNNLIKNNLQIRLEIKITALQNAGEIIIFSFYKKYKPQINTSHK